jgi:hypothetical protein
MADRELLVRIVGDDKDLQRALGSTEKRVKQIDGRMASFGKNVTRAFAAAGIAVGAAEVFQQLGKAVDAASALNEEIAKSNQIFGDAAAGIQVWSETTARSLGIAQVEALEATGTFGNLFATVGLGQEQSADMSKALVQLATDLGSFNNADPSDVLQAIRSGLIGEAEPLRRYGVLLSETRVQQEAMAATGKNNVKELTNQEKALARYNIILQDTSVAQGDFARTSGGLAGQTKILEARMLDLRAELGTKLLPTMLKVTESAIAMIDAFSQGGDTLNTDVLGQTLEDVDVSGIQDMRDRLAEVKGEGDDVVKILDQIISRLKAVQGTGVRPDDRGGIQGIGAITLSNARVDAEKAEAEAKEASRARERQAKAFDAFVKGQGLKLDKAGLTNALADDIAVLDAIEAAIVRRIAKEGKTFELVDQLTQVRIQRAGLIKGRANEAEQSGEDAYDALIDALNLDLEMSKATKSFGDDLSALRAIETALQKRIAAEGETTDLLRQLFQVRQEQAEVARQIAEQAKTRRQGDIYERLGLTREGEERAPGGGALRRRAQSLLDQIKGTALDTEKNRRILKGIINTSVKDFREAGREVRGAIQGMLNEISSAMDGGDKKLGQQITPGGIRPVDRLIKGLGLSEEQVEEIRRRSLRRRRGRPVNAFGVDFDGGSTGSSAVRGFSGMGDFGPPNVFVTVEIDGQKVTGVVKKELQKSGKRRTNRRAGAFAGRGSVL